MATLVVIRYPDPNTAEQARHAVDNLGGDTVDAERVASISRDPEGRYHVHTCHSGFPTASGAIWGGFWGFLFGTLFLIPFAGWAAGAGLGAWLGRSKERMIDEPFVNQVRDKLQPGTSALFMVIEDAAADRAIVAAQDYGGTVIETTLSEEHMAKLQKAAEVKVPTGGTSSSAHVGRTP